MLNKIVIILSVCFVSMAFSQNEVSSLTQDEKILLELLKKKQAIHIKTQQKTELVESEEIAKTEETQEINESQNAITQAEKVNENTKIMVEPAIKQPIDQELNIELGELKLQKNKYTLEKTNYENRYKRSRHLKTGFGIATAVTGVTGIIFATVGFLTYDFDDESESDGPYTIYDAVYEGSIDDLSSDDSDDEFEKNQKPIKYLVSGIVFGSTSLLLGIITIVQSGRAKRCQRNINKLDLKINNINDKIKHYTLIPDYNFNTQTASLNLIATF